MGEKVEMVRKNGEFLLRLYTANKPIVLDYVVMMDPGRCVPRYGIVPPSFQAMGALSAFHHIHSIRRKGRHALFRPRVIGAVSSDA